MKLFSLLTLSLLAGAAHAAEPLEGQDHSYATLLLSAAAPDIKLGAKSLARGLSASQAVFDIAANTLWLACDGQDELDADTQAWLAIALGRSGKPRYRNVLLHCRKRSPEEKVRDHAEEALDELPRSRVPQLKGGSLPVAAVTQRLAASIERDRPKRSAQAFANVAHGEPIDHVYRQLGLPDAVEATAHSGGAVRVPGPVRVNTTVTGLMVHYQGLGTLMLSLPRGETARWSVAGVLPVIDAESGNPQVARVQRVLASPDFQAIKSLGMDLIRRAERDRKVLDVVAGHVAWAQSTEDDYMADALAWLCKALGQSGDGRYKAFLEQVAEQAAAGRLRGHAEDAAEQLPDGAADAFQPRAAPPSRERAALQTPASKSGSPI